MSEARVLGYEGDYASIRNQYLGGHDAAAILGASRFHSIRELYAIKTGLAQPENIEDSPVVQRGIMLEPHALSLYENESGRTVQRVTHGSDVFHSNEYPWAIARVDGLTTDGDRKGVVEAKTAFVWTTDDWSPVPRNERKDGAPTLREVPLDYAIQGQHYLAVTGRDFVSYPVVFVGPHVYEVGGVVVGIADFGWVDVDRNDRFIETLMQREREFVARVQSDAGVEGEPFSHLDRKLFDRIVQTKTNTVTNLGERARELVRDIANHKRFAKQHEQAAKAGEAALINELGDYEIGVLDSGGNRIKYATVENGGKTCECGREIAKPYSYKRLTLPRERRA